MEIQVVSVDVFEERQFALRNCPLENLQEIKAKFEDLELGKPTDYNEGEIVTTLEADNQ